MGRAARGDGRAPVRGTGRYRTREASTREEESAMSGSKHDLPANWLNENATLCMPHKDDSQATTVYNSPSLVATGARTAEQETPRRTKPRATAPRAKVRNKPKTPASGPPRLTGARGRGEASPKAKRLAVVMIRTAVRYDAVQAPQIPTALGKTRPPWSRSDMASSKTLAARLSGTRWVRSRRPRRGPSRPTWRAGPHRSVPAGRQWNGGGGVPNGIRTRVLALKGLNPRPLDDGDPRGRRD